MTQTINNTTTTTEDASIAWFNNLTYEEKVEHVDAMGMLDHLPSAEEKAAELVRLGVIRLPDDPALN